jgi:hypothetical protein
MMANIMAMTDADVDALVDETDEFSPAEIEVAVQGTLFDAESQRRPVRFVDVQAAVASTRPLAKTFYDDVQRMRVWARENARPTATAPVASDTTALRGPR